MKKIIGMCIALTMAICAFAETHVAAGIRGSYLGLEPTLALCINDFEAEVGCAMSRNVSQLAVYSDIESENNLVLTPNITIGWNYEAGEYGWHNTFGFAYYCPLLIEKDKTTDAHIGGMSYRGSMKFRNNLELCLSTCLPFIMVNQSLDNPVIFTIVDQGGVWDAIEYAGLMTTIGLRVNF